MLDLVISTLGIGLALLIVAILLDPISSEAPKARAVGPTVTGPARFRPAAVSWPPLFVFGPMMLPEWAEGLSYTCVYCSLNGLTEAVEGGRDHLFQGATCSHFPEAAPSAPPSTLCF
jgi:hypothetical protein